MRVFAALLALSLVAAGAARQPRATAIDDAFRTFFAAASPAEAERLVDDVLATRVTFEEAYARLKKGRAYAEIPDSDLAYRWKHPTGVTFRNVVEVPDVYDPSRSWPARVQLHGGIGRPAPQDPRQAPGRGGAAAANRIAGDEPQFYIYPSGWADAEWWDDEGVDNILRLVDVVKRRYNVDENRIYLTGISDGGTGVYFIAMKAPTPWASYLPLNGMLGVLRNPDTGASGELYGHNLVNAPLYIVNGENDPLYPVSAVRPYIAWMETMGVPLVFRPQAGAGHNTAWWPTERAPFEAFVRAHPRVPHPERLTWETERTDRYNRIRWLVVDRIRPGGSADSPLEDTGIFRHVRPSGRVDITRRGNAFDALTRGVGAFTLLLSPDVVDFSKPVSVTVNGRSVFMGVVKQDIATLLTWAARDNDRTMLYGAELRIAVP